DHAAGTASRIAATSAIDHVQLFMSSSSSARGSRSLDLGRAPMAMVVRRVSEGNTTAVDVLLSSQLERAESRRRGGVKMRTIVKGGWVVGWNDDTHVLFRDGVVVFEDTRIVHVGSRFDGRVDRTIDARGKLISPGFIDTHVHSGHRASHRLISDTGRPDYFGQPFLEISVPRE